MLFDLLWLSFQRTFHISLLERQAEIIENMNRKSKYFIYPNKIKLHDDKTIFFLHCIFKRNDSLDIFLSFHWSGFRSIHIFIFQVNRAYVDFFVATKKKQKRKRHREMFFLLFATISCKFFWETFPFFLTSIIIIIYLFIMRVKKITIKLL